MRQLVLRSFQSPGDIVMLTAAVRDLHATNPGQFQTDVRTSADSLWEHNPHITRLSEGTKGVESFDMHYPLIHQSNHRPFHFIHAYAQFLEQRLGVKVDVGQFRGDIHLSPAEKATPPLKEHGLPERFWIIVAGGKYDFTAKWWNPDSYQTVVDHFKDKITFVQVGEAGHWHQPLKGVVSLVGKTTTRQFVHLMHWADGVVCPVTFAMHLAAAVETRPGRPQRPCVVIAGGREPAHWEAYTHHQYISTNGMLSCCQDGGCWKSRCQPVGDGDGKDRHDLCEQPVQIRSDLRIPRCMDMISPQDVIRRIEMYLQGGATRPHSEQKKNGLVPAERTPLNGTHATKSGARPHRRAALIAAASQNTVEPPTPVQIPQTSSPPPTATRNILLTFRHGLGDAVQFTSVLKHLRHYHRDWEIDVHTLVGKHSAFEGLCRKVYVIDRESPPTAGYQDLYELEWHENLSAEAHFPSTKTTRCLQEVFRLKPLPELCRYEIQTTEEQRKRVDDYLSTICGPADENGRYCSVLIHYEGNTSSDRKNLPHEVIRNLCGMLVEANYVPIILDWDRRSPLPDSVKIHNPHADHPLWERRGTGDAGTLAALIAASSLMIGVDSGPLHVAGATTTPTIGVWTRHHPIHYFDHSDNVTHLIPADHASHARGSAAVSYFLQKYQHQIYQSLQADLLALVRSKLKPIPTESQPQATSAGPARVLRATGYTRDYYEEHKQDGLDYLAFGDWQQRYGRWIVQSFGFHGRRTLDVGCACGSILKGLSQAGAIVQGVDICESMIQLGRAQWPDMAPHIFTCDAVNLHLFPDGSWDGLHSAQVAEHWKPELVPYILRELARVTVRGGFFFCALDTEELFARQNRLLENEDPTHICIRPMAWWHEQLSANGWAVCTDEWKPALQQHPETFLHEYDWDYFVARRE